MQIFRSTSMPDSHSHRVTNTKCRIDTVISADDGHIVTPNMQRKEINILRNIVHQVGFIYKIIQGCTVDKALKNVDILFIITEMSDMFFFFLRTL